MRGLAELLFLGIMAATPEPAGATAAIIDGPTVLERSPAAIQASLGRPVRTQAIPRGDFRMPEGGTARVYAAPGTRIDVDFEKERSTTVVVAFPDAATAPKTYEAALAAVNLRSGAAPSLVRRDSREWHELEGYYFVRVIAAYPALDHIDSIILSIRPLP